MQRPSTMGDEYEFWLLSSISGLFLFITALTAHSHLWLWNKESRLSSCIWQRLQSTVSSPGLWVVFYSTLHALSLEFKICVLMWYYLHKLAWGISCLWNSNHLILKLCCFLSYCSRSRYSRGFHMDGGVCLSSMTCFCWCIREVNSNHVSIYPHQLLILFLVSQT
jgi:hypothetical protein